MANKVLNIGNTEKKIQSVDDVVYQDISLQSNLSGKTRQVSVKYVDSGYLLVQDDDKLTQDDYQNFIVDCKSTKLQTLGTLMRISSSINVRAVQNSLDNIFRWIPGERILNPEFGSKLHEYLYEGITKYNEEQIVAEIKNQVQRWEPRVVITNVVNKSQVSDREDNTIVLDIKYYIKGLPDIIYDKQYIFNRNM